MKENILKYEGIIKEIILKKKNNENMNEKRKKLLKEENTENTNEKSNEKYIEEVK